jgi:hypothetical protein
MNSRALPSRGSVAPDRALELHRTALRALEKPPTGDPDLARRAYHGECAGDVEAVLRFAPAAAEHAAAVGAHREAAAQYARALRFGDRLPLAERAELLERRSRECFVDDQQDAAIEAIADVVLEGCVAERPVTEFHPLYRPWSMNAQPSPVPRNSIVPPS